MIDLFGTAGGILEFRAALLASRGIATLSLPYFAYDDLPESLLELNLDYFMVLYLFIYASRYIHIIQDRVSRMLFVDILYWLILGAYT